jgi:hypothetical protein
MIKRYLCCNRSLLPIWNALSGAQPGILRPNRPVFAGTPAGPGAEATKEKLSLDNLEDRLQEFEDEKKLTPAAVTAALKAIRAGGDIAKQKVLNLARKIEDGSYKSDDFEARLPAGAAKADEGKKPEGKEGKPEGAAGKPEGKGEKPEAGKEKPEAKEAAEKGEDAKIVNIREKINRKSAEMMEVVDAMEKSYQKRELVTDKMRENFEKLKQDIAALNELDNKNNAEFDGQIKTELDALVAGKKITAEEAKEILELDRIDRNFETGVKEDKEKGIKGYRGFNELTQKLTDEKDKAVVTKILGLKEAQAEKNRAMEADVRKKAHEMRKVMDHMSRGILQKAEREKMLKNMTLTAGVNMAPGQKLTYQALETDSSGVMKLVPKIATIKDIKFVDESAPIIILETENAAGERVEDPYSMPAFLRLIDARGATEKIDSMNELEKSIGVKVEEGDTINYLYQQEGTGKMAEEEKELKIQKIDKAENRITLSEEVELSPQATPTKYLTFGEFAKWFKRKEGAKEVKSFEDLRNELRLFNDVLNTVYKRKAKNYPPIEVQKDEILKYGDGGVDRFVITDIDDKHITLDDGSKRSPTGFLRWVKKNEVGKSTPETDAAQETEMSGDKAEKEKIRAEKEKEAQALLEEAKKEDGHHANSHEDAGHSIGYLTKLWAQTRLLSPASLYEMGKTFVELIKRKLKRSEQDRMGTVGSRMFGPIWSELGAEFKSKAQAAENEEVEHHLKTYRTMGYENWIHELHEAPTKDILKAAITVLCEKGQMRWDDEGFWKAMNKYTFGELKDDKGNDLVINSDNYMTAIEKYLDHWWGQDTFREFRNKQDSAYNSTKSSFSDHAARLEGDPDKNGGLGGALQKLLFQHLKGEHVNAAQFESYLHYAIEMGKLGFEDKLFFLMMGAGTSAPGAHGLTLLHIDRVSAMEGKLLNNFPILDYFTSPYTPQVDAEGNPIMDPATGEQAIGRPDINNYRKWIKDYIEKDLGGSAAAVSNPKALKPGLSLQRFIQREAVWDDWVRTRLHKSAKNTSQWDHDDMDVHAAFMTDELVNQLVLKQGGATQQVSTPGLKNAVVGFSNFMKVKMDMLDEHGNDSAKAQKDMMEITNLMKSFMKLDAILSKRYHHGAAPYARFSDEDWNSFSNADTRRRVATHAEEARTFIQKLCENLDARTEGRYSLAADWKIIMRRNTPNPQEQTAKMDGFGEKLSGALAEMKKSGADSRSVFLANKGIMKGVGKKSTTKSKEEQKENASVYEFQSYTDQMMANKIEEYKELTRKIGATPTKTPEQIKIDSAARLQEILAEYDANKYGGKPEDSKILDQAIEARRSELNAKMRGGVEEAPAVKEASEEKGAVTKKAA